MVMIKKDTRNLALGSTPGGVLLGSGLSGLGSAERVSTAECPATSDAVA